MTRSTRRMFGRQLLATASALGLRTIGVRSVLAGGALGACSTRSGSTSWDALQDLPPTVGTRAAAAGSRAEPAAAANAAAPPGQQPSAAPALQSPSATDGGTADCPRDQRVIIVGSGYGAAVTAARLTDRGIPVLMLEMARPRRSRASSRRASHPSGRR